MIHDIDMIVGLVGAPVTKVDAVGTPVMGRKIGRRQCAHQLRVRLRRQCHRKPGQLQEDRAAFAHLCQQQLSELRSRRAEDLRLQPQGRSHDPRAGRDRHRHDRHSTDGPAMRSRTSSIASATGKKPFVNGHAGAEALRVAVISRRSIDTQLKKVRGGYTSGDTVAMVGEGLAGAS